MRSVEERLQRLEAIEAIRQLKARYLSACDNKQPSEMRDCFVDGPMDIDYGRVGRMNSADELLDVFKRLACEEHIVEMHHAQNPQIMINGPDEARATWGLYYFMIDTRRQLATQLGGVYEDEYRRVEGEWKISKTVYRVTSTNIMELGEGITKVVFAGREAPMELDDPALQAR